MREKPPGEPIALQAINPLARLWLIPQDGNVWVQVFHAVITANDKAVILGLGRGVLASGEFLLTDVANLVLTRCCEFSESRDVNMVEIRRERTARRQIETIFAAATPGSVVMLVCATSELIDVAARFFRLEKDDPPVMPERTAGGGPT